MKKTQKDGFGSSQYKTLDSSSKAKQTFRSIEDFQDQMGYVEERVASQKDFASYESVFTLARGMKREVVALLGPTNSGKTHEAMEALKAAESGVYLAPLRLLALENKDRMVDSGVPCNLITGEEMALIPGSKHTSQTIETLDFDTVYDVAIIDEIQMLGDPARGGAWTAALLGVPAKKVYVCGSKDALPAIEKLMELTGDSLEVNFLERKSPLKVAQHPIGTEKIPQKGAAIVCFSRKEVLAWRDELASKGFTVACIYGALSPEVRKEQARLFREGEAQVLVATDAIGMGLNLPLETVIFSKTDKFDGEEERPLTPSETRQIGGRAGRYGIGNFGLVTAFDRNDLEHVRSAFDGDLEDIPAESLLVSPTNVHIKTLSHLLETKKLSEILEVFSEAGERFFNEFKPCDLKDRIEVAKALDTVEKASLQAKTLFSMIPINASNASHIEMVRSWLERAVSGKPVYPEDFIKVEKWHEEYELEEARKRLTAFLWIAMRVNGLCTQEDEANARVFAKEVDKALMAVLAKKSTRKKIKKAV